MDNTNNYRTLLRKKNFVRFWMGQSVSQFGDAISLIAVPLVLYDLTKSPMHLALGFLVSSLPWIFFGPIAGVLVDRFNKVKILWSIDLMRMVLIGSLFFAESPIHIYIVGIVSQMLACTFSPARSTVFPEITGEELYMKGLSLVQSSWQISQVIGPAIATTLLTIVSFRTLFIIDAVTFLFSAILLQSIGNLNIPSKKEGSIFSVIKPIIHSYRYLRERKGLKYLLSLDILISVVSASLQICILIYFKKVFGDDRGDLFYGVTIASSALGLALGSLFIGFYDKYSLRPYYILFGLLFQGLAYVLLLTTTNELAIILLFVLAGIGASGGVSPVDGYYAKWTSIDIRGRIFSLINALKRCSAVLVYLLVGLCSEIIRIEFIIFVTGLLLIVGTFLLTMFFNLHFERKNRSPYE